MSYKNYSTSYDEQIITLSLFPFSLSFMIDRSVDMDNESDDDDDSYSSDQENSDSGENMVVGQVRSQLHADQLPWNVSVVNTLPSRSVTLILCLFRGKAPVSDHQTSTQPYIIIIKV